MDSLNLLLSEVRNALRMLEEGECGMSKEQEENAYRSIQYYKNGVSHFDELTARGCISQMYYYDSDTHRSYAPFVSYEAIEKEYRRVGKDIPDYKSMGLRGNDEPDVFEPHRVGEKMDEGQRQSDGEDERVGGKFSDGRGYCSSYR